MKFLFKQAMYSFVFLEF